MRKLILGINLTADGCCDHTKSLGYEDIHQYFTDLMQDVDLLIYGRKTYELMVPFWPDMAKNLSGQTKAMNDFAQAFDAIDRLVFSHTLDNTTDEKTRIVRSNPGDEVRKLKLQPGKNMLVGGVALPSQLIELGLVDEFHVAIHPLMVGAGRRFLEDSLLSEKLLLTLTEVKALPSGCVALRYLKQ